jgi:hypothetical protein
LGDLPVPVRLSRYLFILMTVLPSAEEIHLTHLTFYNF